MERRVLAMVLFDLYAGIRMDMSGADLRLRGLCFMEFSNLLERKKNTSVVIIKSVITNNIHI